jgi:hypothetical protein
MKIATIAEDCFVDTLETTLPETIKQFGKKRDKGHTHTIIAGTGACTVCSCKAYDDDGSGLFKCKCGDRKSDHL